MLDLTPHQPTADRDQHAVDHDVAGQGDRDADRADIGGVGLRCLEQPEHDPGLASNLGEDPAAPVGDDREDDPEQRGPTEPPGALESAPTRQQHPGQRDQEHQRSGTDHQAEAPVLNANRRDIVSWSVLPALGRLDLVDPLDVAVPAEVLDQAEQVRDPDRGDVVGTGVRGEPGDREDREALAVPGAADGLGCGHLHRLLMHHQPALTVAERHGPDDREKREGQRQPERPRGDIAVAAAQHQVTADGNDEHAAGGERTEDRVRKREQHGAVEQHGKDVGELGVAGGVVDRVADRMLHPGVRRQDEVGR